MVKAAIGPASQQHLVGRATSPQSLPCTFSKCRSRLTVSCCRFEALPTAHKFCDYGRVWLAEGEVLASERWEEEKASRAIERVCRMSQKLTWQCAGLSRH